MLKDWRKVYRKIRKMPGLTEFEKWQMARSLAAMPEERWAMNETRVRALGFYDCDLTVKERIRFSKDFVGLIK